MEFSTMEKMCEQLEHQIDAQEVAGMNRSTLPHSLMLWLEDRGFNFDNPERRGYLTDDEVYSAALEVWDDMHEYENLWNEETPSWEKAQLKRFINKWSARCKQLELADWYGKEVTR